MRSFTLLTLLLLFLNGSLQAQSYIMDGSPITDCNGFFLDSGGGNSDYGNNENLVTTICSDGSSGTHVKMVFSGVEIGPGDLLCFYDGADIGAPQLSCHDDFLPGAPFIIQATAANPTGCVTIQFTSDGAGTASGWSADMSCIPSCQTIIATLSSTDPIVNPPDTGYIDICPGDRVFFNAVGEYPQDGVIYNHSDLTSGFYWDFGDGNAAVGPNTSHIYDEPGGYIVELVIEDQFGCTNTNFISQRVRVSTYPDFEIAGDIPDEICAGDTISLSAFVSNIDSTFEVSVTPTEGGFPTGGVRSDSLPLPDGTGATYATSIVFNNFSPGQVLTDINDLLGICVNMEHSWMHDLQIELVCPDGTTVVLQQQVFQGECFLGVPNESDEGFDPPLQGTGWNYCWTPTATNGNWTQYWQNTGVQTLPEGDYNAFGDLTDFLGCPLNGEWTIVVQDLWGIDNGWIFEWSIDFAPELYPNVETFTPQLVDWEWNQNSTIVYYSNDSITAALNNAGSPSYTFTVTDDFGCSYDTTVVVNVLPPTHPNCYECVTIAPMLEDSTICIGDEVALDASPNEPLEDQLITFEAFSNVEFDGDIHPPGNPIESPVFVSYVYPDVLTDPLIQIESVCVNIEHSYDADIEIRLQAPNGTIIELSTDNGGSGDDYLNTCFTPLAATPITAGAPPFTGDFQPEGNWADLNGTSITGFWTLLVADDQNGFDGVFIDWSITFNSMNEITYIWSPSATLSCNNCPDPVATPSATTEYTVNTVDVFGCVDADMVTIEVQSSFPAPDLTCGLAENGNLTIDWDAIPGGMSYEISLDGGLTWIPANGPLSHTINGLMNGESVDILVQVVTVNANCPPLTGSLQCLYTEACAMTIDTTATIPPSCWNTDDASIFMSATAAQSPVSYSLNGGPGQGPNINGVSAGLQTIVATDNAGCMDTITFTITSPDTIMLDLVTDSISCFGLCDGQSTALATGGTGAFNYVWNTVPATFTDNVNLLCLGNYTVTATDVNGCTIEGTAMVDEPEELAITMINPVNLSCFGDMDGMVTIGATGGTGAYTYQWDDPANQTTNPAIGLGAGSYGFTVTDANGCFATGFGSISGPATELTASVTQTFTGCGGAMESTALVTAMGGAGNYTYEWSNTEVTDNASNLDGTTYFVTVTDDNGCSVVESIDIDELAPIIITLNGVDPTCFEGADGEITIGSVSGGALGYTYLWNTTPPDMNPNITGLEGGVIYTLTVTDQQGCTGTASYQMGQPAEMQLFTDTETPSCSGFGDGEATVVNVQGGTPGYTYLWDVNAGNQTTQTALSLPGGTYSVTVIDFNGCTAETEVTVDDPATMQLNFQTNNNICPGQNEGVVSVNVFGGTPNYTYEWENGELTQTIDNLWSGGYTVTVTDANGCFIIDSANVVGPAPIEAILDVQDVQCFGDENGSIIVTLIGGSAPYQYTLNNTDTTASNIFIGLSGGTYTLAATDINGCTWDEEIYINSPDEFTVNAGPEVVEIMLGDSIELIPGSSNSNGFVFYEWLPPYLGTLNCEDTGGTDCDTPFASPENTITYELYGVDENGCEATDMIMVRVIKERAIHVATGFTPNGDGNNDLLMVHGPENTKVKVFRVYDRWGELVFEGGEDFLDEEIEILVNDTNFGWDGTFKGAPLNPGVFVWYAEVEYIDGFTDVFKGNTTLIK